MKKQASLLNFFNKSQASQNSNNSSQNGKSTPKIEKMVNENNFERETINNKTPIKESSIKKQQSIIEDDDMNTPSKLYKRLKKVKIVDDDQENEDEIENYTPRPTTRNGRSTRATSNTQQDSQRMIAEEQINNFKSPASSKKKQKVVFQKKQTRRKSRNGGDDDDDDFIVDDTYDSEFDDDEYPNDANNSDSFDDDDDFIDDDDDDYGYSKKKKKGSQKKVVTNSKTTTPKSNARKKGNTAGGPSNNTSAKKKGGRSLYTPNMNSAMKSEGNDTDMLFNTQKEDQSNVDISELDDVTPDWARKENCRDAHLRAQSDPNYDPTTLYIPPGVIKSLTPTMKQYWELKSQNFDKILLFKLGKFYELFYDDALICHKELDLNWMGRKMHVGFPEKALERYAYELVSRGYKVCVVEQTETPKQMEKRLKQSGSKKEKTIRRELVQVMSKGTYINSDEANYEPRFLLAIRSKGSTIAVTFLEIATNLMNIGIFNDDENYTTFKTLVSQIRPSEVIYESSETSSEIMSILRNLTSKPVLSPVNNQKHWNQIVFQGKMDQFFGPLENWPQELQQVSESQSQDQKYLSIECLSGMMSYLTSILIVDNVLSTARYEFYDPSTFGLSRMILDSQALQHLEILEVSYQCKDPYEGSLLSYIDKTVSKFGKRLLKSWILAPLLNPSSINDRLDAIEELESHHTLRDKFRIMLKKQPDIERMSGRMYNYSVKKNENVHLFEQVGVSRLKEFRTLTDSLIAAQVCLEGFSKIDLNSSLLQKLLTFDDYNLIMNNQSENMPDIIPLLKELSDFVQWNGDVPTPKPGVDQDYDAIKAEIDEIKQKFEQYLVQIKQQYFKRSDDIYYSHTKHRYEIDIPVKLVSGSSKPKEFEFSSKKQGRERFVTKFIKDLAAELDDAEDRLRNSLNIFASFLFSHFHQHYKVWDRFIGGLSQLDCLSSLSMTSFLADGVMCRPEIHPANETVFMEVRDMRHPCISQQKSNFVSNDILIGDIEQNGSNQNVILLTGPNMGGKSTILRQACIAAILAQLGCYVPASVCRLSVVDRIFTRIGASDKLMEGKSTFYIEMEETSNILKYGSKNSLAIVDELGRGTSTFDGVSIAYAVLNHILQDLQCRALFATHYHVLLDEFRENNNVSFYHMSSKIDEESEKVIFLYKLIEGECSNSFGLNIARITGMPSDAVKRAKEKADEFDKKLNIRDYVKTTKCFKKTLDVLNSQQNLNEEHDILQQLSESFSKYFIN